MNNATVINPKAGDTFQIKNQTWIIERVYDFDNNEALKFYMNKMGKKASLTIRKPNGKKLYSVILTTNNTIWEADIINA